MEFICRHCDEVSKGDAYRVVSEENGVILLDIIVCFQCAMKARGLELSTQKLEKRSEEMIRQLRFNQLLVNLHCNGDLKPAADGRKHRP